MIDNDLGHTVKNIKKTALLLNHKQIIDETTKLIKHWKEMQSKQVSGKRDSPDRCTVFFLKIIILHVSIYYTLLNQTIY